MKRPPLEAMTSLALLLSVFLFSSVNGQPFPPNNCDSSSNPGPPQLAENLTFRVGENYTACLRAVPIQGTDTYLQFTPDNSSTGVSYQVDNVLFSRTCVTDAGQILVKVPDQPGLVKYTVMYTADGTTSQIIVYAGMDGTYNLIEGSSVIPDSITWITFYDSSVIQNLLNEIKLCQQDGLGAISTFTEGRIGIVLTEDLNICDNPNSDVALWTFEVTSSPQNAPNVFLLVVVNGTCMNPLDVTDPLTYSVTPPTTPPTQVTSNGTTEPPTQETTVPSGPSGGVIAGGIVGGVAAAILLIGIIMCIIFGIPWLNKHQGRHLDRRIVDPIPLGAINLEKQKDPAEEQRLASSNGGHRRSPILHTTSVPTDSDHDANSAIVVFYPTSSHESNRNEPSFMAELAVKLKERHQLPLHELFPLHLDNDRSDNSFSQNIARVLNSKTIERFYIIWSGELHDIANKEICIIQTELVNRPYDLSKVFAVLIGEASNGTNGHSQTRKLIPGRIDLIHIERTADLTTEKCANEILNQAPLRSSPQNGHINRAQPSEDVDGSEPPTENQTVSISVQEPDHRRPGPSPPSLTTDPSLTQQQQQEQNNPPDPADSAETSHPPPEHSSLPATAFHGMSRAGPPPYSSLQHNTPAGFGTPVLPSLTRIKETGKLPNSAPGTATSSPQPARPDPVLMKWFEERDKQQAEELKKLVEDGVGKVVKEVKDSEANLGRKVGAVENKVEDTKAAVDDTKAAVDDTKAAVGNVENKVEDTKAAVDDTKAAVGNVENKVEDTKAAVGNVENKVEDTKAAVDDTKAAVDDTKAAVGNVENKVDKTTTAVDELQDDSNEIREDLKELLLKGEAKPSTTSSNT